MPPWQREFMIGLQERDKKEKEYANIYYEYTKLADKTVALQAERSAPTDEGKGKSIAQSPKSADKKSRQPSTPPTTSESVTKLRQDFSQAQRNRSLLVSQLQAVNEELERLKTQSTVERNALAELLKERDILSRSVKDRDEELKGKAKLLEDLHDETVSLTLQLNMADGRVKQLEEENKDLVERWMKRMGEEADQMNETSRFS